jgi:hypothetical protein
MWPLTCANAIAETFAYAWFDDWVSFRGLSAVTSSLDVVNVWAWLSGTATATWRAT